MTNYDIYALEAQLESMSDYRQVQIYNAWLDFQGDPCEKLYENDEDFFKSTYGSYIEVARAVSKTCDYDPDHALVYLYYGSELCSCEQVGDLVDFFDWANELAEEPEFCEEWGIKLIEEESEE